MREIKFRGRATCSDRWVYGSYVECDGGYYIIEKLGGDSVSVAKIQVDPETVGQSTGLKDKNGFEIYEGDIAKNRNEIGVIRFDTRNARWSWDMKCDGYPLESLGHALFKELLERMEIIGDIHTMPKLMEKPK